VPATRHIKVAIADSNALVAIGMQQVLGNEPDFEVVGTAANHTQLIALLDAKRPDILMIDFTARGFTLELVGTLQSRYPELRIVAITPDQDGQTLINALKAGVVSYIKKDCDLGEVVASVRDTAAGGKFFCGQILDTIRAVEIDVHGHNWTNFNCEPVNLSERELEIITLIAEGLTNSEIADRLFLSPHTVNTHRKNIMQKLGVKNTASVVMYAVKAHLVNVNRFLFSGAK
jgi:DNA-binding NarL/FixJ family response regulator